MRQKLRLYSLQSGKARVDLPEHWRYSSALDYNEQMDWWRLVEFGDIVEWYLIDIYNSFFLWYSAPIFCSRSHALVSLPLS